MANLQAGYGLDQDGYIVSDVGIDKIDVAYLPCIHECVEELIKLFPHRLHSVYVYGSVGRGEAVKGGSDLDLIVMFNGALTSEDSMELKTLSDALSQKYRSLVRDVGVAVADVDYTVDPTNYYEGAFLKEISVCVHGEDLRVKFGPYKLTPEIPMSFNGDIGDVVSRTVRRLESASDHEFKRVSQGFARKLIRTYYSMVMVRSQIWTTRLHQQAEAVIQYFPEKESVIRTMQAWLEEAPTNHEQVLNLVESEGNWVTENFESEARTRSS
ncbi:nucleotidyltransferase family protein [Alicyclobacillus ferrooxydans]|uniref:nucleotidyltransferase family protein n=1 Tax=Alicyclobacillus ferrooxydans TaxID=471514 RepID=UPI000A436580|nr:nucleotidyltransferase domain-containing protein [Alicyclobacillus ferrooxydans]